MAVTATVGRVPLGAGGQITGIHIASDGRKACKTDVYNGYWWDSTDLKWKFLFDKTSIGSYVQSPVNELANGVWEVAVAENAPSTLNRVYVLSVGACWVSNNVIHGGSMLWTKTTMPSYSTGNTDPNGAYKFANQKMVVDPNNQNVIYVATPTNGVQRSLNGGTTWSTVAAITMDQYWGGAGLAIDGTSGTTTLSGVTVSNVIIVPSATYGAWRSSDGGSTWTRIANGTASPASIWGGHFGPDGTYWCTEFSWNPPNYYPWKYTTGGAWVSLTALGAGGTTFKSVVTDPTTSGRIIFVTDNGTTGYETLNNMATNTSADLVQSGGNSLWQAAFPPPGVSHTATDIPWLALADTGYFTNGDVVTDPSDGSQFIAEGVGVFRAVWPTTYVAFNWVSQSVGIEELVSNGMVHPPGSANPFFANSDRGVMTVPNNMTTYATTYIPSPGYLYHGWEVGYASSDPTFMYSICNFNNGSFFACSSSNSGSTWTVFPDQTPASAGYSGGSMAFATPSLGVWIPAQNRQQVSYTTNGGTTWSSVGASLPNSGWSGNQYDYAHGLACDRGDGTFYAFNNNAGSGHIYTSPDGINWTAAFAGVPGGSSTTYAGCLIACPTKYTGGYNVTGHVWFCAGPDADATSGLAYSTNHGVTWTTLANISRVWSFAFGKPRTVSASNYSVIYAFGSLDGGTTMGLHMSEDMGANWQTLTTINPGATLDQLLQMGANEDAFGRVYLGYLGSGWIYVDIASANATTIGFSVVHGHARHNAKMVGY